MSLTANKINLSINGYYLLAETLSLSQNSEQKAGYVLNNALPFDYIPNTLKNTLNLSYFLEPRTDANYKLISGWKNNTTGALTVVINLGNIIFTGFLSSYSFGIVPNQSILAQSTYDIFVPITGNFIEQLLGDVSRYAIFNNSGIAHYWTTSFLSGDNTIANNNILQADYSFQANLQPVYSLGKIFPVQVTTINATENINIISESQFNLGFSGTDAQFTTLQGVDTLRVKNVSSVWSNVSVFDISFSLVGFRNQSNKMDINLGQLVVSNHSLSKNY